MPPGPLADVLLAGLVEFFKLIHKRWMTWGMQGKTYFLGGRLAGARLEE